jgi:hypothetical protein
MPYQDDILSKLKRALEHERKEAIPRMRRDRKEFGECLYERGYSMGILTAILLIDMAERENNAISR